MERGAVENGSARRYDAGPRSANQSMSTKNTSVNQSDATTDDEQIMTAIDNLAAIREGEDPR